MKYRFFTGSCKDFAEVLCILHPVFPGGYILWNYSTILKLGIDIGTMCLYSSFDFITCIYLCNPHCSQDTDLFHHHKALPYPTSFYSNTHPLLLIIHIINLFSIFYNFSISKCYLSGIMPYVRLAFFIQRNALESHSSCAYQ